MFKCSKNNLYLFGTAEKYYEIFSLDYFVSYLPYKAKDYSEGPYQDPNDERLKASWRQARYRHFKSIISAI